ncbi:MAG: FtsX-like permease family protein [Oligoflexia bacterium]|nr:FtsX-like permease family protein [Oligoflexia bacterium]
MKLITQASKGLLYRKKFTLIFIINLALGLGGLVTLDYFKNVFDHLVSSRAKSLLGSDLELQSRFPIADKKIEITRNFISQKNKVIKEVEYKTLFTMAKGEERTRLVSLQTIPKGFPFYGDFEFDKASDLSEKIIHAYKDVLVLLGNKGDNKKIIFGEKEFEIGSIVLRDPQQTFGMGAAAPRIFLSPEALERAELIRKGSTVRYRHAFKLERELTTDEILTLKDELNDIAIRINTPEKSSEQVGRLLRYLNDFLGLVSLSALLLALIGIYYLFRAHIYSQRKTIGIYLALGMKRKEVLNLYIIQTFLLATLGTLFGIISSLILSPSLFNILEKVLEVSLPSLFPWSSVGLGLFVGLSSVFLVAWPFLLKFYKQPPQNLFEESTEVDNDNTVSNFKNYLPLLFFVVAFIFYLSNSLLVGSIFTAALAVLLISSFVFVRILLIVLEKLSKNASLEWSMGFKYISRFKLNSFSVFVSLFFSTFLLVFIPSLNDTLQKELDVNSNSSLPSFFMFDIQDEQKVELEEFFEEKDYSLIALSPMIRGRLLRKNGEKISYDPSKKYSREEERAQRLRNRGINISFKESLSDSESIVSGKPFSKTIGEIPEVSVEVRYAERLKIKLGDIIDFDIAGIEVQGKVVNFRKVRWTSFVPNFFLVFQPGFLEDAPKTWLAAVSNIAKEEVKSKLQIDLVDLFPNVSSIDVTRVVNRIRNLMTQMAFALQAMAFLCFVVGIFVLFALCRDLSLRKLKDVALLKVVGMVSGQIRRVFVIEILALAFFSTMSASIFGILTTYIFGYVIFDYTSMPSLTMAVLVPVIILFICVIVSQFAYKKALKTSASFFLED